MTHKAVGITTEWVRLLLFAGALSASVFYQGFYTEFLCLAFILILAWAVSVAWSAYGRGVAVPKTSVALCLTLFWIWLGVSAVWGRVSYVGTLHLWWLGSFVFVFWIYTLAPPREDVWRRGFYAVVLIGVALALAATWQALVLHVEATATFFNRNSLAGLLNLIALPLCGYFLLSGSEKRRHIVLGAALFVIVLALGLIKGRGATIAGAIAFIMLLAAAWHYAANRRVVVQLAVIVLSAFLVATQLEQFGVGQRFEALLHNPYEAGSDRLVIWRQSWEMLTQAPWMGVGIGHYALHWPQYRDPTDASAGYFVHNDYLQIWIEAGLPGLLLLLAVLVSVLVLYIRALRARSLDTKRKLEMTALFGGLLAVALHSAVDFNLYVLSTLLLTGLVLARLHALAQVERQVRVFTVEPAALLSKNGYRLVTVLIAAVAFTYFLTLGLASIVYQQGLRLADQGKIEEAYETLDRAARYYPYADNVIMSKADLLRHVVSVLPPTEQEQRRRLFEEAERLLVRAEALNPLRAQTFTVHANLYEQNPELVGADWSERVSAQYRRALEVDPRIHQARFMYGRFLLKQGQRENARRVLEDGMKHFYPQVASIVSYYALTASLRQEAGDREGAEVLRRQIDVIQRSVADKAPARRSP